MNAADTFKSLLLSNREAMEKLRAQDFPASLALLQRVSLALKRRAQELSRTQWLQLKSTTLNNLACYYRKCVSIFHSILW